MGLVSDCKQCSSYFPCCVDYLTKKKKTTNLEEPFSGIVSIVVE